MNKSLKFQLAGYVDDGMRYSNSAEVRNIVDSSDVAKEFYETLLFANKRLEGFFQSKEMHKTNKKLHSRHGWCISNWTHERTKANKHGNSCHHET